MLADKHVTDLLPALAIGCLDDAEAVLVLKHVENCELCRAELEVYQALADNLPLAAPQVSPPAAVKARLMQQVEASKNAPVQAPLSFWERLSWPRLSEFLRQAAPVGAVAGLVAIIVLAFSTWMLWRQAGNLQATNVQSPMRVISLEHTTAAPEANGLIVLSTDGDHGTLVVDNLPDLGSARQYQLWLIKDGKRTSGGVFSVSKDGYGSLWVDSPQPLSSYTGFGITIEPTGGSPGPTGEKVLGGNT